MTTTKTTAASKIKEGDKVVYLGETRTVVGLVDYQESGYVSIKFEGHANQWSRFHITHEFQIVVPVNFETGTTILFYGAKSDPVMKTTKGWVNHSGSFLHWLKDEELQRGLDDGKHTLINDRSK